MLTALPYTGGKARAKINRWIASILPTWPKVYCEPFAGMMGVLLNREPAYVEIVNDASGDVINWWQHVVSKDDTFVNAVSQLPYSRQLYQESFQTLQSPWEDSAAYLVNRAIAYHTVIKQGTLHGEKTTVGQWALRLNRLPPDPEVWTNRIDDLSDRTRRVQFENIDAVDLIRKIGHRPDTLIYCDPPYPSRSASIYAHDVDQEKFVSVVQECKALVAVSGYAGDWPDLDWTLSELEVTTSSNPQQRKNTKIEGLYTNWKP